MDDPASEPEKPTSEASKAPEPAEPRHPPAMPPKEPEPIVVQTAPGEILGSPPVSLPAEGDETEPGAPASPESPTATAPPRAEPSQADPSQADPAQADPPQADPLGKSSGTEVKSKPRSRRKRKGLRGLAGWVESRAQRVVSRVYQTQADDLEKRARRVVGSAYREHSDDLEERAIRVLRSAIADEADRIKEAISHGVAVKKREVRLSLVVLIVASLMYLALYWFTEAGGFD